MFYILVFYTLNQYSLLIAAASGLLKIANTERESGHPCLVSLWRQKLEDVWSFVRAHVVGKLYIFNEFMKKFLKPNLFKLQKSF